MLTDLGLCLTTKVKCPRELQEGLVLYVTGRLETGGFLRACLENNLTEAISRADMRSVVCLHAVMRFIWNELPSRCWGTPEKVQAWLDMDPQGHGALAAAWIERHPELIRGGDRSGHSEQTRTGPGGT